MIAHEKQTLRDTVRAALRNFAGKNTASQALATRLRALDLWRSAKVIYAYSPLKSEPDWRLENHPADAEKIFAYPRITGHAMLYYTGEPTQPSTLGTLEPAGTHLALAPDLILVPGLAFDRDGYRLGRGGGYYDRWLSEKGPLPALGLCFDCQVVPTIPREPHDIHVDAVLTETQAFGLAR